MPNRRVVTIDIETIPKIQPETVLAGEQEMIDDAKAELAFRKTALSGDFGRILCIGYTDECLDGSRRMGVLGWDKEAKSFHLDEKRTLKGFWNLMRGFSINRDHIVGHNIFEFDLRFIIKRSIINGIRPTVNLSFRRYVNQPVFDTMREWECWSYDKIKLEELAEALSLPSSKTDCIDGSKVFDYQEAGRHREIFEYCLRDVRLTREIYRRMTFCEPENLENFFEKLSTGVLVDSNKELTLER